MANIQHPETIHIDDAEVRAFERIVRNESHAAKIRHGEMMCMSTIAWECGFKPDRRVLLTADALKDLAPTKIKLRNFSLTEMMDLRAEKVLRTAAKTASGLGVDFAEFSVSFPGEEKAKWFTISVEAFGSKKPVVVIGSANTDMDAIPTRL